MRLARDWRGDALLWHTMDRYERAELMALDRYIASRANPKSAGLTATMSKAERLAEFQRRRAKYAGVTDGD